MSVPRSVVEVVLVSLMVLGAGAANSQNYPYRPIRIVTGTTGGGVDVDSRLIAEGISGPLGQPVIVQNISPAIVEVETAAKAPPDGYTLLVAGASLWIFTLFEKASYDTLRDFAPIRSLTTAPNVMFINPTVPVYSIKELIALAKAKPGELNYGSGAAGGTAHLAIELFKAMAGVNIRRITYKGAAPAITAVLGNEVQLTVADTAGAMTHVKSGRVRALAITSAEPSALAPGIPTVAASGVPGYESVGISGLWAPAKTPPAIINRLNQEITRFLSRPEVKERFFNSGSEITPSSPEQFAAYVNSEIAKVGKIIKDAGITAQ